MKETEKIFNQIEAWTRADGTDRVAVVIMADLTTNKVGLLSYGTIIGKASLVEYLMDADKECGKAIYASACIYAHKHIEAEERKKINAAASAIAEDE